jgi:hypothetical protein
VAKTSHANVGRLFRTLGNESLRKMRTCYLDEIFVFGKEPFDRIAWLDCDRQICSLEGFLSIVCGFFADVVKLYTIIL